MEQGRTIWHVVMWFVEKDETSLTNIDIKFTNTFAEQDRRGNLYLLFIVVKLNSIVMIVKCYTIRMLKRTINLVFTTEWRP